MNPNDRKRLEDLKFSAEVIARTEEVLRLWEIENLFAVCVDCGKPCYNPDLPRGKFRRKKLPADLFQRRELWSYRKKRTDEIVCWPCDEIRFQ